MDTLDDELSPDYGTCGYYLWTKNQDGPFLTCSFGCFEEPECITCEPDGGWPLAVTQTNTLEIGTI